MRVVVPFTKIADETREALDASGYPWEAIDVSDSLTAYWELLSDLWGFQSDLCIVEHDIVVGPDTLKSFDECPNLWCGSPYPYLSGTYAGLGCTRFRAAFMVDLPTAVEIAGRREYPNHGQFHWCVLDDSLKRVFAEHKKTMCMHLPVDHVGDQMPTHEVCRPR